MPPTVAYLLIFFAGFTLGALAVRFRLLRRAKRMLRFLLRRFHPLTIARYGLRALRGHEIATLIAAGQRIDGVSGRLFRLFLRTTGALGRTRLGRRHFLHLTYIDLIVRGERERAAALLRRLPGTIADPLAFHMAVTAAHAGDHAAAEAIMTRVTYPQAIGARRAWVIMAHTRGEESEALRLLAAIAPYERDTALIRLAERLENNAPLHDPSWLPTLEGENEPIIPDERGRVLHLLTNSLPATQSGYTLRSASVMGAFATIGFEPHVVTRAGYPSNVMKLGAPDREEVNGVVYHRIEPDAGLIVGAALARRTAEGMDRLVGELAPVAIHTTTNHLNSRIAHAVAARRGIPVVYEVRGFIEETFASRFGPGGELTERYRREREAETAAMLRADALATLSETMRAEMIERGVPAEKIVVIPNAVDVDDFTARPKDEAIAAEIGIAPDETVVGYISSIVGYEGIRHLIDAVVELRRRGRTKVRLLIVGDGVVRPELERQAAELGLDDAIFTGRVPHEAVKRYYSLIDVFVVPRTADRVCQLVTPMKPYEAMAMERAIVVSDVAALREIVADGETGRVFRAEDPLAIADVLADLIDDPAERRRLGANARAWVSEHRTWRANAERYRELYGRLNLIAPLAVERTNPVAIDESEAA
jgi:PEP-CTERM/exosortase A-associated glycosyltransferase